MFVIHEQVMQHLQHQDKIRKNPRLAALLHPYLGGYRADGVFSREQDGLYFTANDTRVAFARERILDFEETGNPFAPPNEEPKTELAAFIREYMQSSASIPKLFAYPYIKRPGKVYGDHIALEEVYPVIAYAVWAKQHMSPHMQVMLGYAARVHAIKCLASIYLEAHYAEALQYQVLSASTDADARHIFDIMRP
jgi:hypothetical protein